MSLNVNLWARGLRKGDEHPTYTPHWCGTLQPFKLLWLILHQVLRATDDCTTVLARVIDANVCIDILNQLSDTAECPVNLAAIKMEEKVIRSASQPVARAILNQVVPTLIKVCCLRMICNLEQQRTYSGPVVPIVLKFSAYISALVLISIRCIAPSPLTANFHLNFH